MISAVLAVVLAVGLGNNGGQVLDLSQADRAGFSHLISHRRLAVNQLMVPVGVADCWPHVKDGTCYPNLVVKSGSIARDYGDAPQRVGSAIVISNVANRARPFGFWEKNLVSPTQFAAKLCGGFLKLRFGIFARQNHRDICKVKGGRPTYVFEGGVHVQREKLFFSDNHRVLERGYSNPRPLLRFVRISRYFVGGSHRLGVPFGYGQGLVRVPSGRLSSKNGLASVVKRGEQPQRPYNANYEPPQRIICRISSGICGLPLSAKIALTIILSGLAWPVFFHALDLLDGLRA